MRLSKAAELLCSFAALFCIEGNIFVKTESSAQAPCGSLNNPDVECCPLEAVLPGAPRLRQIHGSHQCQWCCASGIGWVHWEAQKYTEGKQVMKSPWFLGQVLSVFSMQVLHTVENQITSVVCIHILFLCSYVLSWVVAWWLHTCCSLWQPVLPLQYGPSPLSVLAKIPRHLYGTTNMGKWETNLGRGTKEEK